MLELLFLLLAVAVWAPLSLLGEGFLFGVLRLLAEYQAKTSTGKLLLGAWLCEVFELGYENADKVLAAAFG